MKKLLLALGLGCLIHTAHAGVKVSSTTKVSEIESYSEYGEGDVIFSIDSAHASCPRGYWLKKSDPGFEANLSILLSAFHSQSNVIIRGHDNQIWGGSSGTFCHLYSIKTVK